MTAVAKRRSSIDYEEHIFGKIYRAIAPHDPEGLLQHEWLNSRGAIARFDVAAFNVVERFWITCAVT